MQLHCLVVPGCALGQGSAFHSNPTQTPMIPEFEDNTTVVATLRRNLHLALRRRTWSFKRNARLNELLPPVVPVRRQHTLRACAFLFLVGLLSARG